MGSTVCWVIASQLKHQSDEKASDSPSTTFKYHVAKMPVFQWLSQQKFILNYLKLAETYTFHFYSCPSEIQIVTECWGHSRFWIYWCLKVNTLGKPINPTLSYFFDKPMSTLSSDWLKKLQESFILGLCFQVSCRVSGPTNSCIFQNLDYTYSAGRQQYTMQTKPL